MPTRRADRAIRQDAQRFSIGTTGIVRTACVSGRVFELSNLQISEPHPLTQVVLTNNYAGGSDKQLTQVVLTATHSTG
jgi:hypothetical protein